LPFLFLWVEQRCNQIIALPLPNDIRRSQAIGLALNVVGSLIWGGKMRGIGKYRGGGASALGHLCWQKKNVPFFQKHDLSIIPSDLCLLAEF
jgi:hypothetical protein